MYKRENMKTDILDRLGKPLDSIISRFITDHPQTADRINEIRIRSGSPLILNIEGEDFFISGRGRKCDPGESFFVASPEVQDTFIRICQNSPYAFEDDIKNGFITLPGGHRVGIGGHILPDGRINKVSSLNIRIAREVKGCSNKIIPHIIRNTKDIYNTLIISPPCCGKTTVVRDIARILAGGDRGIFGGISVGIVDERSEIAACYKGVPCNDIGIMADVLDACKKQKGILMMIRSLSPKVIITDEIGGDGDFSAIMNTVNAGARIIATAHGYSLKDAGIRKEMELLIENKIFERYIILSNKKGPGTLEEVIKGEDAYNERINVRI